MNERVFVFDVDGTLTPARETMNLEFEQWFFNFCQNNDVFLVSGSDRPKTLEQVGQRIYDSCLGVYQCNGNEHWCRNRRIKSNGWKPSYQLTHHLEGVLNRSTYHLKTGTHLERRTGMSNFSTVGRNANIPQRKAYFEWDNKNFERETIRNYFQKTSNWRQAGNTDCSRCWCGKELFCMFPWVSTTRNYGPIPRFRG